MKIKRKYILLLVALAVLVPSSVALAFTIFGQVNSTVTVTDPLIVSGVAWEANWPQTNGVNPNLNAKSMNFCSQTGTTWNCGSASLHVGDFYSLNGYITSVGATTPVFQLSTLANATTTYFFAQQSGCPSACQVSGSWASTPYPLSNGGQEAFSVVVQFTGTLTNVGIALQIGE